MRSKGREKDRRGGEGQYTGKGWKEEKKERRRREGGRRGREM